MSRARRERVEEFLDWRFGIFVHWGLSAGFGDQGSKAKSLAAGAPYSLIDRANRWEEITTDFDPDEWIRVFKAAGARYFVMTVTLDMRGVPVDPVDTIVVLEPAAQGDNCGV